MNINILVILLILLIILIILQCNILYNMHLIYTVKINTNNERNRFNFNINNINNININNICNITNNNNKNNDKNIIKSKNNRNNKLLNLFFLINIEKNKLYIINNEYKCIIYNLQYNISYDNNNDIIMKINNISDLEYYFYIENKMYLHCNNITLFDLNTIIFDKKMK